MTRPLVVVEGSDEAFAAAVRDIGRAGARVGRGWRAGATAVAAGEVLDASDAAEALLAAVAGAGVVVHARAAREIIDRLVDDLRRLGPVDHRTGEPESPPGLTLEESGVLDRLAAGLSLGNAAAALHLSRRTADRRLASAKCKLGVETTAEAVVRFLRDVR